MTSAETLSVYEGEGRLFHGSRTAGLERIEPKQAKDANDGREFNNDTAVFASPIPAVAAAFACIDTSIIPIEIKAKRGAKWAVYYVEDRVELGIPRYFKEYFNCFSGYVYVIDSEATSNAWQAKLYGTRTPVAVVSVEISDFFDLGGVIVWLD